MFSIKFLKNFPAGVCLGFVLAFILCAIFDANFTANLKQFYAYLVTAVVSLGAATLALSGVLANLQLQTKHREEDRLRRLSAARAFLPHALSSMCEISKFGMINSHNTRQIKPKDMPADFIERSIRETRLSDETISILKDIVELSTDNSSDRIQLILREHQAFSARWRSFVRSDDEAIIHSFSDATDRTISWAVLYALSATAFSYARGKALYVDEDVTEDSISAALQWSGISLDTREDGIRERMQIYLERYRLQKKN